MVCESILYENLTNERVQCNICNHNCIIDNGNYGLCGTRLNNEGILYSITYGQVSSLNSDPVEKKPFYHFHPNSLAYSVGGFACNMSCLACQNYTISQVHPKNIVSKNILPETIVENALKSNSLSIAYTYNEPTMFLEYVIDTAKVASKNKLKNLYISNGYMTSDALDYLLKYIDGFNIDLKFLSNKLYGEYSDASLDEILDNLIKIYESNAHLEITNLLINGLNDSPHMIRDLINFIKDNLSPDVPVHFTRAFPYYKMNNILPTNPETLINAYNMAKDMGLQYVYLGNIQHNQDSYCPECGELLIKRNGYFTSDMGKIVNNKCSNCGCKLNFRI
ncbi:AmmeMemoRadiSam system radical SAM enzyme [Methanobrevibacter sp.]